MLGGSYLLPALVRRCKSEGMPISVITAPRHAADKIEHDNSLDQILRDENIPYIIVEDITADKVSDFLGDLENVFCLSVGAAWKFKKETINGLFCRRLFNLHGTRLPQNRGGGGFSWQIMMGNRLGFCQLHLIEESLDKGNIVKTEEFLYPPSCRTPKDYQDVYIRKNLDFVIDFIEKLRQGDVDIETTKQTEYFSSYFPRLNTYDHGWINWDEKVIQLEKFICAFDEPYEGAKCFWNDQIVFIKKVCVNFEDQTFHPYQSGIIYRNNGKWLCVCAIGGSLIIEKIVDSNGKNLLLEIKVGDRLVTKNQTLEGRLRRVVYTPVGKKTK